MTESIEQIKDRVQDLILDRGFAIQYQGGDQPYGYTIGRTLLGRPELLISGLPQGLTEEYLNNAVPLDNIEPFEWGTPRRYVFGERMTFPVSIDPWNAQMFTAIASFGQITALQLLWPDDAGAFPGDPDYAHDVALQRVFA